MVTALANAGKKSGTTPVEIKKSSAAAEKTQTPVKPGPASAKARLAKAGKKNTPDKASKTSEVIITSFYLDC